MELQIDGESSEKPEATSATAQMLSQMKNFGKIDALRKMLEEQRKELEQQLEELKSVRPKCVLQDGINVLKSKRDWQL